VLTDANATFIEHAGYRLAMDSTDADVAIEQPGVIFCGGFKSDMQGNKALALKALCAKHQIAYTRFDYSGHGQSDGAFSDGNIDRWLGDTLAVFDTLNAERNTIVIGSSMGAWIATLAALRRHCGGLLTIAAAPDFTERLLPKRLTDEQQLQLQKGNTVQLPSEYDDGSPYPITAQLLQQSRRHCLLMSAIELAIPVRLLHGTADIDVPYALSIELMDKLQSNDAQLTLIKGADHRMSSPDELAIIERALFELIGRIAV